MTVSRRLEEEYTAIRMTGTKYPDLVFDFFDCRSKRPVLVRTVFIGKDGKTFCDATARDDHVPNRWKLRETGPGYETNCGELEPGTYGIEVMGEQRGTGYLTIAADGTASLEDKRCVNGEVRRNPKW